LIDYATVLSILIPVLTSIAYVAYRLSSKLAVIDERFKYIDERFKHVDERFKVVEERLARVEEELGKIRLEVRGLREAILQYNEMLLTLLESKGVFTKTEVSALRSLLATLLPRPSSKYYTKEVEMRLRELLAKDPDELTLAEVDELDEIGERMWLEGVETNRKDLREYGMKLKVYATLVKVVCIYPKLRRLQEGLPGLLKREEERQGHS
jgi:chromosome segregation ATPase